MKKVILSLIAIMGALTVCAQNNISVAAFRLDPTDITANTRGTSVMDQNGEVCALIKVRTTQTGFSFDVGVLGVTKTEQHTGEIWVYVPHGIKHITIQHQHLGTCEYPISISVDKARTYIMELTTGKVTTVVEEAAKGQFVVFQITPSEGNAIVQINDENLDVVDGTAMKYLNFGTYDYRVSLKDYHDDVGKLTVNDPNNKQILQIRMRPAFGWIDIKENAANKGAKVFLDNELIGTIPLKTSKIKSGRHSLKIVKTLFANWEQQITVSDSLTTTLTPELGANYANVTLTSAPDAEIWVNGEKKGTGEWSGNLAAGDYLFETKALNHRTSTLNQTIATSSEPLTITLPAPVPIVGKIEVTTMPAMADVFVDGKKCGQTPVVLNNILIGEHSVSVSKEGYGTLDKAVTVSEGNTSSIGGTLSKSVGVTISTNNPDANITIDGVDMGRIKNNYDLSIGRHSVKLTSQDYEDLDTTINVDAQHTNFAMEQSMTPEKQFELGKRYYEGNGVTQDYAEAMKWYRKAAEQGNASAQDRLGYMYATGTGVTQDDAEAVKWFRKAAEQGYARAQYNLGIMYENGRGVTKNYAEAVKWYRKAAEQGDANAQNNLGYMYDSGQGVTQDYAEAAKWYRKAAAQGYANAQYNLGIMYERGRGVTKNYAEAVKWYRKAAAQGSADAQYNLGVMYDRGRGVTKNYAEAVKWYRKAAEQGDATAQCNLGVMYYNGQGVTRNYTEATKWYRKAAEQGNATAQCNLGTMYYNGQGVTRNYNEAFKWYNKSVASGDHSKVVYNNLANCYRYGCGTSVDYKKAEYYEKLAAEAK